MGYVYNPLSRLGLDKVGAGSAPSPSLVTYARFPKKVTVFAGGSFTIEKNGAAQIFVQDFSQGFTVLKQITVNFGGALTIEANAKGTVKGS